MNSVEKISGISCNKKHHVWVEKYRPQTLNEIILPDTIRSIFQGMIDQNIVTNLLLVSPKPGSGKTTTALAIARELGAQPLFIAGGKDASVDIIRNDIMQYATSMSLIPGVPKIIVVDEVDNMSSTARMALKTTMELVAANASFILTTNSIAGIPDPVTSRCQVINYTFPDSDKVGLCKQLLKRVQGILDIEGIKYELPVLFKLIAKFYPDNRSVIQELQKYSFTGSIDSGIINVSAGVSGDELLQIIKSKDYNAIKTFVMNNLSRMNDDIYSKIFACLEGHVTPESEVQILLLCAKYQKDAPNAADKYIHILATIIEILIEAVFV